jgi:hypothetical protein
MNQVFVEAWLPAWDGLSMLKRFPTCCSGSHSMSNCKTSLSSGGLGAALVMALLAVPLPGNADVLYKLDTTCSVKGAAPAACTVEAEEDGKATLYRHKVGNVTETVRITDSPVTMSLYNAATKQWVGLSRASARFSSNTICFNGKQLCVVNPNYLNSVREDNPAATAKRDLVKVHFGRDGRIDASCYDDGCEVTQK